MILVSGASGTAGSQVVKALDAKDVLRATRFDQPSPGERRFDYADPTTWRAAFEGIEAAFLMLPPGLPKARQRFKDLLAEAKAARVERVVFLSIRNADRLPFLPHRGIEKEIEESGLAWTHVRPNDWMQNLATQPLYRSDIARGELWLPNGRSRTSYVDVRDVAAAAALALRGGHERRVLSLTGPADLDPGALAALFTKGLGRAVQNRAPSLLGFVSHALREEVPASLVAVMTSIGLVARLGLAQGVDKGVAEVLGRSATSFEQFVANHSAIWGAARNEGRE